MSNQEQKDNIFVDLEGLKLDEIIWVDQENKLRESIDEFSAVIKQMNEAKQALKELMQTSTGGDVDFLLREYEEVINNFTLCVQSKDEYLEALEKVSQKLKALREEIGTASAELANNQKKIDA